MPQGKPVVPCRLKADHDLGLPVFSCQLLHPGIQQTKSGFRVLEHKRLSADLHPALRERPGVVFVASNVDSYYQSVVAHLRNPFILRIIHVGTSGMIDSPSPAKKSAFLFYCGVLSVSILPFPQAP